MHAPRQLRAQRMGTDTDSVVVYDGTQTVGNGEDCAVREFTANLC